MKPLLLILLVSGLVEAQSIADIARRERARQAKVQAKHIITSTQSTLAEDPKPATPAAPATEDAKAGEAKAAVTAPAPQTSKEPPKPQAPPAVDPVQAWNNQLDQLRARIRTLQDQELALQLQLNQANNQVFAPVTDPSTQQRALALVGQIQQQLAGVRKELEDARKTLDSMQLQGPPKK